MPPETTSSTPSTAPASAPSTNTSSTPATGGEQKYNPFRSKDIRDAQSAGVEPKETGTPAQETNHSVSGELSQQPAQPTPPPVAQQPVQPQVVQMTPEMLARLIPQQQPQTQAQPQQQAVTQEDFNRRFNVAQVDAAQYEAIIGVAPDSQERVNALNNLLQGVAKQAVTMSRFLMEQQIGQLSQQLNPIQEQFVAQREESYKRTFFDKHKDLSGHEPLLREIVESARLRGMSFPTPEEAMAYVATTARKLLGAQAPQQISQGRPVQSTQVPMPSTMSNGRSGSGGAVKAQPTAQRIFGRNDVR